MPWHRRDSIGKCAGGMGIAHQHPIDRDDRGAIPGPLNERNRDSVVAYTIDRVVQLGMTEGGCITFHLNPELEIVNTRRGIHRKDEFEIRRRGSKQLWREKEKRCREQTVRS